LSFSTDKADFLKKVTPSLPPTLNPSPPEA